MLAIKQAVLVSGLVLMLVVCRVSVAVESATQPVNFSSFEFVACAAECLTDVGSATLTISVFNEYSTSKISVYGFRAVIEGGTPNSSSTHYGGVAISAATPVVQIRHYSPGRLGNVLDATMAALYQSPLVPEIRNNVDLFLVSDLQQINGATLKSVVDFTAMYGKPIVLDLGNGDRLDVIFSGDFTGLTTNRYLFSGRRR